jgi:hypothetical protein
VQKDWPRILETCANVSIVVLAAIIVYVLVLRRDATSINSATNSSTPQLAIKTGDTVELPELIPNKKNLILVLQPGCRVCGEEMPFYRELSDSLKRSGSHVALIAYVTVGKEQAHGYLKDHQLNVDAVSTPRSGPLPIRRTPTLVLLDTNTTVTSIWEGRLSSSQRSEIFKMGGVEF